MTGLQPSGFTSPTHAGKQLNYRYADDESDVVSNSSGSEGEGGSQLLSKVMSNASKDLLASLMGKNDDIKALQRAVYVAPPEPAESASRYVSQRTRKESTFLLDKMSDASKGLLASLVAQTDDMSAIKNAKYQAPAEPAISAKRYLSVEFADSLTEEESYSSAWDSDDEDRPPLLSEVMSEASKGLLASLMGKDDDVKAMKRAKYVAPPQPAPSAAKYANARARQESQRLIDKMSDTSKGLLAELFGKNDDMVALKSAMYLPPQEPAESAMHYLSTEYGGEESDASSSWDSDDEDRPQLLSEVMSEASKGLLASLLGKNDDLKAMKRAMYVAPAQPATSAAKYANARVRKDSKLLIDKMSDTSKGLLAELVGKNDDISALKSAMYEPPLEPAESAMHYLSTEYGAEYSEASSSWDSDDEDIPQLLSVMSEASKGLLASLMGKNDDMKALKRAKFVAPPQPAPSAAKYVNARARKDSKLLIDKMSDTSKGLLAELVGKNDDMAAFKSAMYEPPLEPAESAMHYLSTEYGAEYSEASSSWDSDDEDTPQLLSVMSEASKGLLASLMGKKDDMKALKRAKFVAPPQPAPSAAKYVNARARKDSKLLIDKMSDTSKGLLVELVGKNDDMAAFKSAMYEPPLEPAESAMHYLSTDYGGEDSESGFGSSSSSLSSEEDYYSDDEDRPQRLSEAMSETSKGLLAALVGKNDDMRALKRAKYVAPSEPAVSAMRYVASRDATEPLLMDQMSEASQGLLASLMGKGDDQAALYRATYTIPPEPAASAMRYTLARDAEEPLLVEQMSEASRGLLSTLMGKDDDKAALYSATYSVPSEPAESASHYLAPQYGDNGSETDSMSSEDNSSEDESFSSSRESAEDDEDTPVLAESQPLVEEKVILESPIAEQKETELESPLSKEETQAHSAIVMKDVCVEEKQSSSLTEAMAVPLVAQAKLSKPKRANNETKETLILLMKQMSATSKDMLESSTIISTASKDLVIAVTHVVTLTQNQQQAAFVPPVVPPVESAAVIPPVESAAVVPPVESADGVPPVESVVVPAIEGPTVAAIEEDGLKGEELDKEDTFDESDAELVNEDTVGESEVEFEGEKLANEDTVGDSEMEESPAPAAESCPPTPAGTKKTLRNEDLSAIKNEDEILALQQARYAQYLVSASEMSESEDEDELEAIEETPVPDVEEETAEDMVPEEDDGAIEEIDEEASSSRNTSPAILSAIKNEEGILAEQQARYAQYLASAPEAPEDESPVEEPLPDAVPAQAAAPAVQASPKKSIEDMFGEMMNYSEPSKEQAEVVDPAGEEDYSEGYSDEDYDSEDCSDSEGDY